MFYYNEGVPDQQYAAGQWDNGYGQYPFPQDNSVGHEFAANNGYGPMDGHPGYVDYSYRNNGPRNHDPYHHGGGSRGMGGHYRDSHQRGFRPDAYNPHQPHAGGVSEAGYGEYGYHNGQQQHQQHQHQLQQHHQSGPPQQSYYDNRSYQDQGRGGGGGGGYQGNQSYRSNNGYRPEGAPIGYGSRDSSTDNFGANLPTIQWDLPSLPHFEKNFYNEHPDVTARSEQSAMEWRTDNQISIIGEGIPKPVLSFEEASMPEFVLAQVRKQGFVSPSPIQSQGWPMALLGRDMIGISATGSGKTLAFLLPALVHIKAQPRLQRGDGPLVLVLAPTRELGMQIKQECDKMSGSGHIRNSVVYGGVAKHSQVRDLRNGVEILIATPGRLIDHLETNVTNLRRVTYLVLDEADRMLDMGFEPQIRKLVSQIRPDRQTLLWSATWPKEVQQLARDLLTNPYEVHVGSLDLRANKAIKQFVEVVSDFEKYGRMTHHLDQYNDGSKVLIFVETKKGCDILTRSLQNQNYRCGCIHGDKSQRERDQTLAEFKNGRVPIMVATDVAARGLDVKDVRIVINFDMPNSIEDYVHRIGRTGRAGAMGVAVSFFTDKAGKMARDLVKVLYEAGQEVPPELSALVQQSGRHSHGGYRGGRFGGRGGGYSHGGRGGGRFFHHHHHN